MHSPGVESYSNCGSDCVAIGHVTAEDIYQVCKAKSNEDMPILQLSGKKITASHHA